MHDDDDTLMRAAIAPECPCETAVKSIPGLSTNSVKGGNEDLFIAVTEGGCSPAAQRSAVFGIHPGLTRSGFSQSMR